MDETNLTKEEIALELTLAVIQDYGSSALSENHPERVGEAVAAPFNTILENVKL